MQHIKNLVFFESIYTCNSFRDSAEQLGVSIATLSRSLKELESDFSQALFIKDGVNIKPTSAAHRLYEKVQGSCESLSNKYHQMKFEEKHMSVLLPPQVSSSNLINLVNEYNHKHNTALIVNEINHYQDREAALDSLGNGRLDLLIDTEPAVGHRYQSVPLATMGLVLIASSEYYSSISTSDVERNNIPFVRFNWLGIYGEQINKHLGVSQRQSIGYNTENIQSFLEALSSTSFVGLFPKERKAQLDERYITSDEVVANVEMHLVCAKNTIASREVVSWFYNKLSSLQELKMY